MDRHDNIEYRALMSMSRTLSTGLRSALTSVLEHALAEGLISEEIHSYAVNIHFTEENRTQKFLGALRDRVSYDPCAFHKFVKILDGEISLKILANKMREGFEVVKREEKRLQAAAAEYNSRQDEIVVPSKPYPVKSQPYVPRNSSSLDMPNHLSDSPSQRRDYHGNNHPAIKPADLPLNTSPSANDRFGELGRFRNVSRTPGISYREKYFERNTGPQSEPADKHNYSPLMAFGSVAYSPKREDGPQHVASTRSACAVAPTGHGSLSTTLNDGLAMKTFTKTQSEQHMILPSTSQCNVPPHPSHIPPATSDPQDLKNLDTLSNQMSQVSLNGNESSERALPGNNMASESTVVVTQTSPPRPDTGQNSRHVIDRNLPSVNSATTDEAMHSKLQPPKDTLQQRPCGQAGSSEKGASDAQSSMKVTSHDRLTLDELNKNHMNLAGIEISTTAPTPIDAQSEQSHLPRSDETDDNSDLEASLNSLHVVGSRIKSGTKESQTLEQGYHERRNPYLTSSLSLESDSSTCESAEIDPIQESKQNSDEQSPLVSSGGIMPGACSTGRTMTEKPKRQRCSRCKKLKQDLLVVRAQLNERDNMLISEREQSTMQVNDLKEQVFRAEQEREMKLRQIERDFEQRHRYAEQLIQKLQRELQWVEDENRGLKMAHNACSQRYEALKADFRRADSLQCPDVDYGDHNYEGMARERYDYSNYPAPGGQPPATHNTTYNNVPQPGPYWQPQHIPQTAHHNNMYHQ